MARIEADWVVVGGGSAGCVLAALLSDEVWVADASGFREVPGANTNLPTIAAAERLSELSRQAATRQFVGLAAAA
jgi:choline dehydrogenase-like flavoprotein